MNVNGMLGRLKGRNFTVTRVSGSGSYSPTDGSYTGGTTETLTVLGSLQPMTPDELVTIPEGDRSRERFKLYTASALRNIDPVRLAKGDTVDVDGVPYEVESVEHWPNHGKAVIVRVNTDEN